MRGSVGASLAAREKSSAACAYWPRAPAIRPSPCQPSAACGVLQQGPVRLLAGGGLPRLPQRLGAHRPDTRIIAELLLEGVDIGQRSEIALLSLRFGDHAQHQLGLGGPPLVLGLVLLLPRQRLLLLLLLNQLPRRLDVVGLAPRQARARHQCRQRRPPQPAHRASDTARHHIPHARQTAQYRHEARATRHDQQGRQQGHDHHPVILTVVLPTFSFRSSRRLSRSRSPKR